MIFTNDNYSTVAKKIAQFVAENAPAGAENQIKKLKAQFDRGDQIELVHDVRFRHPGLGSVSVYVRTDEINPDGYTEDADGNLWSRDRLSIVVYWSAAKAHELGRAKNVSPTSPRSSSSHRA